MYTVHGYVLLTFICSVGLLRLNPPIYLICFAQALTCWGGVKHKSIIELSHHWFMKKLVAGSMPSHYPNQSWPMVN